jgi:hypothetical protein
VRSSPAGSRTRRSSSASRACFKVGQSHSLMAAMWTVAW